MSQQFKRSQRGAITVVAIVGVAILFVFVSVRAMLAMASGEAQDGALDSTKLSFNYDAHEVRLRGYLQALESMGLDFNR